MTTAQLRTLAKQWQKRLAMCHWKVAVQFARQHEMNGTADRMVYGCCWPDPDKLQATVYIARQKDVTAEDVAAYSAPSPDAFTEMTLIHELLHFRLDAGSILIRDSGFEAGLNRVARLLWEGHLAGAKAGR